jgi:hypothetical protein
MFQSSLCHPHEHLASRGGAEHVSWARLPAVILGGKDHSEIGNSGHFSLGYR